MWEEVRAGEQQDCTDCERAWHACLSPQAALVSVTIWLIAAPLTYTLNEQSVMSGPRPTFFSSICPASRALLGIWQMLHKYSLRKERKKA